jgi:hypothetical protein
MRVLELTGEPYAMGQQHADQVRDLRPQIVAAMEQRLAALAQYGIETQPYEAELVAVWEELAQPTLEMLRGLAAGLELEWDPFFRYTIASYLEDRILSLSQAPNEGCTVWAAAAPITRHGMPMLVKNRDYRPDHQPLQCLARARPTRGYRYTYVTSAGSPGVFSSGVNEAGLAVADTHVASLDLGPGLARYSLMMELLEQHNGVRSALDYLRQVPHIGNGTLVLVDLTGNMAVFEAGHTVQGVVWPEHGFVVSTNHFVTAHLRERWVDRSPPELRGNSQNRYAKVVAALQSVRGLVDAAWAQGFMADHGNPQYALCRHPDADPRSATISTAVYLPQERTLLFADGPPCQASFKAWSAG